MSEDLEDKIQMTLYKISDTAGETIVTSAKSVCPTDDTKRVGYQPFVTDGTFARLRYLQSTYNCCIIVLRYN